MTRSEILMLIAATMLAGACGDKPKPRTPNLPTAPDRRGGGPGGPGSSVDSAPAMRTVGGVDLTGASDAVREAALALAGQRGKGVEKLIAAGKDAREVVVRLLASAGIAEITGALEVMGAAGDPTGARAEGLAKVVSLLAHDAADVRAAAVKVLRETDDPAPFIALVEHDTGEAPARIEAIRLLGGWQGAAVDAVLLKVLLEGGAAAREAALALGAPGRTASAEVTQGLDKAVHSDVLATREAGLVLARRLKLPVPAEVAAQAVKSDVVSLVVEGVHASGPDVLVELAADTRPIARRVVAEELARVDAPKRKDLVDKLVKDADADVRQAVAMSLVAIGEGAGAWMDALLTDGDTAVRRAALAATTGLAPDEAARRLRARLVDGADEDKEFIAWLLMDVPGRESIDALIAGLSDKSAGGVAHIVLQQKSGENLGPDVATWTAWADKAFPPAPQPADK